MSDAPEKSPLQAMIDSAAPGAMIKLRPGEYLGAVVIDKPVTLEGHGKKTWIGAKTSPVVLVKCAGVTLRNVMIEATGGGDALEAVAGTYPGLNAVYFRGSVNVGPPAVAVPESRIVLTVQERKRLNEALCWAAKAGDIAKVKSLVDKGADVNSSGRYVQTPLRMAAREGCRDVVAFLLDCGADINAAAANGLTALHWACSEGHADLVGLLLDRGATIDARCIYGETPLHKAQSRYDHIRRRLDKIAGANFATKVLFWAKRESEDARNLATVVDLLLSRGARE